MKVEEPKWCTITAFDEPRETHKISPLGKARTILKMPNQKS